VDVSAIAIRQGSAPVADERLVELAAAGSAEAFEALLQPRLDRLFRMAVAILRSEADARDAVQDASVLAWRELPRLRNRERFDAWLSQILVNACRSQLRRHRRTRIREIAVDQLGDEQSQPVATEDLGQFGEVEAIRAAFDHLDGSSRSLLVLHYVEERPLREIGAILGVPTGTVKWRLWRARHALERALKAEER
jgi:RNA polymerase sigma-70 factor (ECF subfamily)